VADVDEVVREFANESMVPKKAEPVDEGDDE